MPVIRAQRLARNNLVGLALVFSRVSPHKIVTSRSLSSSEIHVFFGTCVAGLVP